MSEETKWAERDEDGNLIYYVTDEEYEAMMELIKPMPAEVTDAINKANRERRK